MHMTGILPDDDAPLGVAERRVVVLGSTGSIGRQALEVIAAVPELRLVGVAAHPRQGFEKDPAGLEDIPKLLAKPLVRRRIAADIHQPRADKAIPQA